MLAERLKATREQLGMTQSEVAKASGLSKGYLSSLESGTQKDPSYRKLRDLAKALSTTPEYLFGDAERHPQRTCKTCMFCLVSKEKPEWGQCHRYPPGNHDCFPIIKVNDFCGEWQKR